MRRGYATDTRTDADFETDGETDRRALTLDKPRDATGLTRGLDGEAGSAVRPRRRELVDLAAAALRHAKT